MRTRIVAAIATTLALTAGLLAAPSPAQAADRPSSCAPVNTCGYNNISWNTSGGYEWTPTMAAGRCDRPALDRQWSGFWNASGRTVRLYKSIDCTGSYLTYYNGSGHSSFVLYGHVTWNDAVRSQRFM
jgi:hypothetical protein